MIAPYHHACVAELGTANPRIAYVGAAADDSSVFAAMVKTLVFTALGKPLVRFQCADPAVPLADLDPELG